MPVTLSTIVLSVLHHFNYTESHNNKCNRMIDIASATNRIPANVSKVLNNLENIAGSLQGSIYSYVTNEGSKNFPDFMQAVWNRLTEGNITLFYDQMLIPLNLDPKDNYKVQYSKNLQSSLPGSIILSVEPNFILCHEHNSLFPINAIVVTDLYSDPLYEKFCKLYRYFTCDPTLVGGQCFGWLPYRFPSNFKDNLPLSETKVCDYIESVSLAQTIFDELIAYMNNKIVSEAYDNDKIDYMTKIIARHFYNAMMDIIYSYNPHNSLLLPPFKAYAK